MTPKTIFHTLVVMMVVLVIKVLKFIDPCIRIKSQIDLFLAKFHLITPTIPTKGVDRVKIVMSKASKKVLYILSLVFNFI